jgi:hypothetical protein
LNEIIALLNFIPGKAASHDRSSPADKHGSAVFMGGFVTGDPQPWGRAGSAAGRLEHAWRRWRAVHGFTGAADPPTSYVGCSLTEPMGQPRVVMGIDAAEAIRFADFLDRRAGLCKPRPEPVPPDVQLPSPPQPAVTRPQAIEAEYPVLSAESTQTSATRAFEQIPAIETWPRRPSDPVGDEITRWKVNDQPRRFHR